MHRVRDSRGAPQRSRRVSAPWVVAAATLCACAKPVPLYEGPVRPDEDVAILEAPGNASIVQVDGVNMERLDKLFALEPGTHVILFRARHTALDFGSRKGSIEMGTHAPQSLTQCFVTIDMKAGHRYVVLSKIETTRAGADFSRVTRFDSTVKVALVDETAGTPVPDLKCTEKKP